MLPYAGEQELSIAVGEGASRNMIFKYCAWSDETKAEEKAMDSKDNPQNLESFRDDNSSARTVRSRKNDYKIRETVLRYCPCVFRCRRAVDIEKEREDSISTIVTTANTTPVIAFRLNRSNDTIDKAVNEEEYNERNRQHFLPEHPGYHVPTLNSAETRFPVDNREGIVSKSASSSSSDISRSNRQQKIEEDAQDYSDSRSSSPQSQDVDAAFDIITNQSVPPDRNTVDSYLIPLGEKVDSTATATITSVEDDTSKEWSSEEEIALRNRSQQPSRSSRHPEFHDEEQIEAGYNTSDETPQEEEEEERRRSVVSVLSNERLLVNEAMQTSGTSQSACSRKFNDIVPSPSKSVGSPKKSEPYSSRSPSRNSNDLEVSRSPKRRNSRSSPRRSSFSHESSEFQKPDDERVLSSTLLDDSDSLQSLDPNQSRRESKVNSPTIIIASRPHSNEAPGYVEDDVNVNDHSDDVDNVRRFVDEASINETLEYRESKDSASETNTEPAILKIESHTAEPIKLSKTIPSRVPRGIGKHRLNGNRGTLEKPEKMKPVLQQCFGQLESKDWEVTVKGLKNLSQITKQHPEYLDVSAGGTIGRLLGRHIKNLRSQVARAACMAAGDIFSSQIRGIDQDIDDIATPLLHRTADTNRFLRADCNAALDRMIEHLPPHKTIGVIVQRGASHQNAIVRAATGRLLASIVDRIGPEHTLILPKDVRDKLLSTGARLLIDGNLDARNHAKKMFRRLTHCEGFRRILKDAVPETTLRHIDKTLRSL